MSHRLLLICYYFPPLGGAGISRPLALMRHLHRHDIECHVLTVKDVAYRVFEPELLEGLDRDRIHRSGSWDPQRLLYHFGRRRIEDRTADRTARASSRFFPDSKVGWTGPAIRLGRKLLRRDRFDFIMSTSPPVSAHLIAHKLAAESGLPWLADFRDFWTSYKAEDTFADSASVTRARHLLNGIKSRAAAISVCNPAIAEYLGVGETIYNSFDSARAQHWQPPPETDTLTVGLLGTYNELVPLAPLLQAAARLREADPEVYEKLRFVSVGRVDRSWLQPQLEQYGLSERWTAQGFRSREETPRLLSAVHLFYLGLTPAYGAGIVPGRLFDMLASGRPILAAVTPDGQTARLLDQTGAGTCFDPTDPGAADAAAGYLAGLARRDRVEPPSIEPLPDYAAPFSDLRMTERFAALLDNLHQ